MSFPHVYAEIARLIEDKISETRWAREIARRAGIRLSRVATGDDEVVAVIGGLPPGGKPTQVITKLATPSGAEVDSDADRKAIGWRSTGSSSLEAIRSSNFTSPGPPANVRALHFHRLRDSTLRSGTSNNDKHGFCIDRWEYQSATDPFFITTRVAEWVRRAFASPAGNPYEFPLMDEETSTYDSTPLHSGPFTTFFRVMLYVTRAEYEYRIRLDWGDGLSKYVFAYSTTTGRRVSDWIDGRSEGGSTVASRPFTPRLFVEFEGSDSREVGDVAELASGEGPIGIPFAEVEQRAGYRPSQMLEYPDEFQEARWATTEWERRIENDIPFIPYHGGM